MQSEIDDIRIAIQVVEAAAGTPAASEAFLLEAMRYMCGKLELIELQQAEHRETPATVTVPVMTMARVAAAAARAHRARFRVIDGGAS